MNLLVAQRVCLAEPAGYRVFVACVALACVASVCAGYTTGYATRSAAWVIFSKISVPVSGCPTWIRTMTNRFRDCCATITQSGSQNRSGDLTRNFL